MRGLYACLGDYECCYCGYEGVLLKWRLPGCRVCLNKYAQRDLEWWGCLPVEDSTNMLVAPMVVTQL